MKSIVLVVILVLVNVVVSFSQNNLLATSYPIYYPLKYIAGDLHKVDVLINAPMDPHHYELKPRDLQKIRWANYIFMLAVEDWERQIEKQAGKQKLVPLNKNINFIKIRGAKDPHLWLSPKSYAVLVKNVYEELSKLDPSREQHYRTRMQEFLKELEKLDKDYERVLKSCRQRLIVSTHLSTSYLSRDYGLESAGLAGMHAEHEPRPSELKKLVEVMKAKGVKSIFLEPGQDKTTAEKIAKQTGAEVLHLNTSLYPEGENQDYFSIMRKNLEVLKKGLECQ